MEHENHKRFMGFASTYESVRPILPKHAIEIIHNYIHSIDTIIDLGCGTGLSTLIWEGVANQIIGIEPSIDMLEVAKQKENASRTYLQGNGENIPLKDHIADVVICSQSFHWMEPFATLREVNRVLKPHGIFVAIDYDWPGVMKYEAEKEIARIRSYVRNISQLSIQEANGYPKSKHIENMNNTGYFEYVREIVFSNQEKCDANRLVNMILSISGFQNCLKNHPDKFIPVFEAFSNRIHEIYQEEFMIEFCYRMRIGIKK